MPLTASCANHDATITRSRGSLPHVTRTAAWWDELVGDLVEILLELDDPQTAERTLDFYAADGRCDRWRVGTLGELRCRALLRAYGGDLAGPLALLDGAIAGATDEWAVDLGRALLVRGGILRVLARTWEARADLRRALAIFTRHGLGTWRSATLRALVGTVSEPDPWSPAIPERIVTAVTGGHWTEREIAARLQASLAAVQREMGVPVARPDVAGTLGRSPA